jgi:hypothetical protein
MAKNPFTKDGLLMYCSWTILQKESTIKVDKGNTCGIVPWAATQEIRIRRHLNELAGGAFLASYSEATR